MKKPISFLFLSIVFIFTINAQVLFSNSGEYSSNANGSLAWSVGEAVIATISDGIDTLTQGFHQSRYEITSISENTEEDYNIQFFPNPVEDYFNIQIGNPDLSNFNFCMYDSQGKILCNKRITDRISKVDMSNYTAANYFVTVFHNGESVKSIQIIKNY